MVDEDSGYDLNLSGKMVYPGSNSLKTAKSADGFDQEGNKQ